ncbi:ester cyclase [Staphylococcus sp. GDY8P120P]|uniref:ester cyclase n=1 Tax=Staphylococcus sp. GDY8P120P TaxID=2804156 RepID=UPI001AEC484C|nr:ester cyclase [Staphylococcus sp. GDY8P120P]
MNNEEIYNLWISAWNKDIDIVNEIADDACVVHQARTDGKDSKRLKGPTALKDIIKSSSYYFKEYKMSLVVEPIINNNYISARWNFTGSYNGNMEGAKAKEGKRISFDGTDIFYIENEKIKDYWVSSDGINFMEQLEIL